MMERCVEQQKFRVKKMKIGEERDKITEMPIEIKQNILSHLSMKDAIVTSSLSSHWRYSWLTRPSLKFDNFLFKLFSHYFKSLPKTHPLKLHLYCTNCIRRALYRPSGPTRQRIYTKKRKNCIGGDFYRSSGLTRLEFGLNRRVYTKKRKICTKYHDYDDFEIKHVGYIHLLEQLWRIYTKKTQTLEVFKELYLYVPTLSKPNMRAYASRVVSMWLSLANRNVQELTCWIDGDFYLADSNYDFLNCCRILESKTLTKLVLHGCYLGGVGVDVVPIDLPCLKQLCLAAFKVDQELLDILLLKCRALETLELSSCKGFKVLRVSGLSKLKDLKVSLIHDLHQLQIDAMPLQCLTLTELNMNKCKVEVAFNSRKNLVKLNINGCRITDDFFNNVVEFPYLKTISLIDCPKLKRINISSASLTTCRVEECPNLSHIELDTPKLFSFQYSSTGNYNIITCSSKCQITQVCLHFKCPPGATFNQNLWHSKLVALLTNFRQSKYVNLSSDSKKTLIIPQELRLSACPPLSGVRELSLKVAKALTCDSALEYLDTLLWLSSHPRTISLSSKDLQSELLVKVHYENRMKEGESCSCASAQPVHCWGHTFKDFEIWCERGLGSADQITKMLEQAFKKKTEVTACG